MLESILLETTGWESRSLHRNVLRKTSKNISRTYLEDVKRIYITTKKLRRN